MAAPGVHVHGLDDVIRDFDRISKQFPTASKTALNKLGDAAIEDQKREMRVVFDRPTPYALRAMFAIKATSAKQKLKTRIRSPALGEAGQDERRYLGVQIFGGYRLDKGSERRLRASGWLPTGFQMVPSRFVRQDAFGNVPGATVAAILRNLFGPSPGGRPPSSSRARYWVGKVGNAWGIWRGGQRTLTPMFFFVPRPRYRPRFDYYGVTEKTFRRDWLAFFAIEIDKAIRS